MCGFLTSLSTKALYPFTASLFSRPRLPRTGWYRNGGIRTPPVPNAITEWVPGAAKTHGQSGIRGTILSRQYKFQYFRTPLGLFKRWLPGPKRRCTPLSLSSFSDFSHIALLKLGDDHMMAFFFLVCGRERKRCTTPLSTANLPLPPLPSARGSRQGRAVNFLRSPTPLFFKSLSFALFPPLVPTRRGPSIRGYWLVLVSIDHLPYYPIC